MKGVKYIVFPNKESSFCDLLITKGYSTCNYISKIKIKNENKKQNKMT